MECQLSRTSWGTWLSTLVRGPCSDVRWTWSAWCPTSSGTMRWQTVSCFSHLIAFSRRYHTEITWKMCSFKYGEKNTTILSPRISCYRVSLLRMIFHISSHLYFNCRKCEAATHWSHSRNPIQLHDKQGQSRIEILISDNTHIYKHIKQPQSPK